MHGSNSCPDYDMGCRVMESPVVAVHGPSKVSRILEQSQQLISYLSQYPLKNWISSKDSQYHFLSDIQQWNLPSSSNQGYEILDRFWN